MLNDNDPQQDGMGEMLRTLSSQWEEHLSSAASTGRDDTHDDERYANATSVTSITPRQSLNGDFTRFDFLTDLEAFEKELANGRLGDDDDEDHGDLFAVDDEGEGDAFFKRHASALEDDVAHNTFTQSKKKGTKMKSHHPADDDVDDGTCSAMEEETETGGELLPSDEVQQLWFEELEMARIMYGDEAVEMVGSRTDTMRLQVLTANDIETATLKRRKAAKGLTLVFVRPLAYPHKPLEVSIEPWHNIFSVDEINTIYTLMRTQCRESLGMPMLQAVINVATSTASELIATSDPMRAAATKAVRQARVGMRDLDIKGRKDENSKFAPSNYIGSVADLLAKLPKGYDVVHCENILREDLALRFEKLQAYYYQKYVAPFQKCRALRLDQHLLQLADITPAFHGTRMQNIGRIVRNGLLVPGQATGIKVRCGSRYGNGIYSSPSAELALRYAESGIENENSIKLMICAVLMGKVKTIYDGEEPWGGGCTKDYDSHRSEDGSQLIVFNEWQMLPCYVVHLMYRTYRKTADGQNDYQAPCTGKLDADHLPRATNDRKKVLTALAKKNLPFGFGPAGQNFVVEEIAPYSDDEEDWGEYVNELRGGEAYEEFQHETIIPSSSNQ